MVMNSWEKDAYTASGRAQGEAKRKGPVGPTNTDNAPRNPNNLKASVGKHCEVCGRPNHERNECKQRDVPGWKDQGRWIDSKAYKTIDARNTMIRTAGDGDDEGKNAKGPSTASDQVHVNNGQRVMPRSTASCCWISSSLLALE